MRSLLSATVPCALVGLLAGLFYVPDALAQSEPVAVPAGAPARAQARQPTSTLATEPVAEPVPKIVLITMGKGVVVWEKFGHGAICVEYAPGSGARSLCYNYGTTDFAKPVSVGWGFLRGEGEFWVSVTTPKKMIRRYMGFDRTLWRQVIPLSDEKARALAARLAHNALPENRNYTYHHFYDNCTTRIRDLLDEATDGKLRQGSEGKPGPSFRDYARQGFSQDAWLLVATDFFLGHGADHEPDLWEAMFLPSYLRQVVRDQLGSEPDVIYQRRGPPLTEGESTGRGWVVFLALLLAIPLALARWLGRFERLALGFAGSVLFLMGFIIWFLAIVTAVEEFRYNENLMIFLPTDLALLFLGPARRMLYARIRVAMVALASLLLVVGVFTQPLWSQWLVVLLPMVLLTVPSLRRATAVAGKLDTSAVSDERDQPKAAAKSGSHHKKKRKRKRK